jgi:hypothetical protein
MIFYLALLPISGTISLVAGMFSAMRSMNTENANKTVMPYYFQQQKNKKKFNKLKIKNKKNQINKNCT